MSYRFLDGKPVTHGPVPGAQPETAHAQLVPITEIRQTLVLCGGCDYAMENGGYKRGTKVIEFWCKTMKCKYRGLILEMPLQSYDARSSGAKADLCQCERSVPDPEH